MKRTTKLPRILKPVALATFLFLLGLFNCKGPSTVDTHPVIWISTYELSFSASEFGPSPSSLVLSIKNSGIEVLDYNITDDANWLTVTPGSGSSSGQVQAHTVAIDKSGLVGRDEAYTAKIKITSQNACNSPQEVAVTLKLTKEPPPEISVSPKELSFAASTNGPNPSTQDITVKNSSKGTLNYTISDDADWLTVNPGSGSSTGEENTHTVAANVAGLAKGTYTGKITISDTNATNNPQVVTVTLMISDEPPPQIAFSPSEFSFSGQLGGADPGPKALRIRNSGKRTLNYSITTDAAWLTVSPRSGSSTGQENTHTVAASIAGLAKGTYQASITISDPNAVNSPQTVRVSLDVTTVPPPPTSNEIAISCNPGSGGTGTIVTVTIQISGNTQTIKSFGLDLGFESSMFDYLDTSAGTLTSGWGGFGGNYTGGVVRIGGFGGSSSIPVGSVGTIAVVRLRVTGGSAPSGTRTTIQIGNFTDDIAGMKTSPGAVAFTFIR
jgi:hypothetical protein